MELDKVIAPSRHLLVFGLATKYKLGEPIFIEPNSDFGISVLDFDGLFSS